ncbi:unnamed protein product [Microthlaspi erraticum]|uniref:Uncharacterized protein n=1 Tax=Microthlaspi erraticum TaxID=1685480 RepID=A0A6D2I6H1_9BRAS|nr:unnamed protein product [Microthlaspi erraticum]
MGDNCLSDFGSSIKTDPWLVICFRTVSLDLSRFCICFLPFSVFMEQLLDAADTGDLEALQTAFDGLPAVRGTTALTQRRKILGKALYSTICTWRSGCPRSCGHFACFEFLLTAGADVKYKSDKEQYTCLHRAMDAHRPMPYVRLLTAHGADLEARDWLGVSPLAAACSGDKPECVVHLLEAGAERDALICGGSTALHFACTGPSLPCIKIFLEGGVSVDSRSGDGYTPLHSACEVGDVDTVTYLLQRGADKELTTTGGDGVTALHLACRDGHSECVRLLVVNGANKDATDNDGLTPLMYAVLSRLSTCVKVVKVLIKNDVNVNVRVRGPSKETALHKAVDLVLDWDPQIPLKLIKLLAPLSSPEIIKEAISEAVSVEVRELLQSYLDES